jgi:hypothetical protein
MTTDQLIEILRAFDEGKLTREGAIEHMVARGESRTEAEQTIAVHLGESNGDVKE